MPEIDHDRLAAWIEHMAGVYQRTIDKHAKSGRMEGRDIIRARNHIQCLSQMKKLLSEHHEMAQGRRYDAGDVAFQLITIATLIKPNGETLIIPRKHHG